MYFTLVDMGGNIGLILAWTSQHGVQPDEEQQKRYNLLCREGTLHD